MRANSLLILVLPFVAFSAFVIIFYVGLGKDKSGGQVSTQINKQAPELNLLQLGEGSPPDNSDLSSSEVKLVNFWASWCAPCRAEHPNLELLNDQGITILGVNYKDVSNQALGFLEELGNPYQKIGADTKGRTAIEWGVYGIPETFIIDKNGIVRLRWAGPITARVLNSRIQPLLDEIVQH